MPVRRLMPPSRTLIGKLTRIYLLVALTVLIGIVVSMQAYLYLNARNNAFNSMRVQATALAGNLESAVAFDDPAFAQQVLDSLGGTPDVLAAQVILANGQEFVRYGEPIDAATLSAMRQEARLDWRRLGILKAIGTDAAKPAQLALLVSLEKLNRETLMLIFASFLFGIVILSAAYLIFMRLSRKVSRPVEELNRVMREVETGRDYSTRAPILSDDEIGELATRFNDMLGALEKQNSNLNVELTERKHMQDKLDRLAHYDTVTQLPNRYFFNDRLDIALQQSELFERPMAVVFVDLDNFKLVNDSYGHHVGDQLLKIVAERLTGALRSGDIVSRLGGDEFAIIIESLVETGPIVGIAEKLIQNLTLPLHLDGNDIVVSGSIGIAMFPEDADNAETLLRYADMAMYAAKGEGKNTWRRFKPSMAGHSTLRLTLENQLRIALDEGQMELHYQPQIDLTSGQISAFEALARWNHPERGYISPAQFIPVAEESGLIRPLGEWVLRTACLQATEWRIACGKAFRIAVNVSARQLQQSNFAERVKLILDETDCPAELIELEITESMLMQHSERSKLLLEQLHDLGIGIAIDDFGTGYSSMAQLKHLPVTKLKIDKSFVDDITSNRSDLAITSAITSLARNLGIDLIAEGVENEKQLLLLRETGCHVFQGFHFSRPLPPASVPQFLAEFNSSVPRKI